MELDAIYEDMNTRNKPICPDDIVYDKYLDTSTDYCYAVYALGNWHLEPSWIRLNAWLKGIVPNSAACFYSVHPHEHDGLLHQTLLQFVSFKSVAKYSTSDIDKTIRHVANQPLKYVEITYRGIVFTKTGIALKGYVCHEDYSHIMSVRESIESTLKNKNLPLDIPYSNNILHATVLRWKQPPTQSVIDSLQNTFRRWDECVFGRIQISRWIVGKATWKMLERNDMVNIYVTMIVLHRGNTGRDSLPENHPDTLKTRKDSVECDVWFVNYKWYLGHDKPQYLIENIDEFLQSPKNLIHAKDGNTFATLLQYCRERGYDSDIFFHTDEKYVLTTRGNIIAYPGEYIHSNVTCMMPENMGRQLECDERTNMAGVCSDNVYSYL